MSKGIYGIDFGPNVEDPTATYRVYKEERIDDHKEILRSAKADVKECKDVLKEAERELRKAEKALAKLKAKKV